MEPWTAPYEQIANTFEEASLAARELVRAMRAIIKGHAELKQVITVPIRPGLFTVFIWSQSRLPLTKAQWRRLTKRFVRHEVIRRRIERAKT